MSLDPSNLPPNIRRAMDRPKTLSQKGGDAPCPENGQKETQRHSRQSGCNSAAESDPQAAADIEPQDAYLGREKDLHVEFERDMTRRGVHLVHAHTHTVSSIEPGLPDYHCLYAVELPGWTGGMITRGCAVEFKRAGGTLSPTQREKIAEMRRLGIPVAVCWTLHDAIAFCRANLGC